MGKLIDVQAGGDALVEADVEAGRDVVVGFVREEEPQAAAVPETECTNCEGCQCEGEEQGSAGLLSALPWLVRLISQLRFVHEWIKLKHGRG